MKVKILGYNYIPNFMLGYSLAKISGGTSPVIGIPSVRSGFGDFGINPNVSQSYYTFRCDDLKNKVKFKSDVTYLEIPNSN